MILKNTIKTERIQRRLDELWKIGRVSDGGVTRVAYSPEESDAHEYILSELPEEYTVTIDAVGNVFATRYPDADQFIATGSHLDTVYNAGRLDGTLGVVASLEAVEAFQAVVDEPSIAPMLTVFRAEESARFGHHTIGSRAALGTLDGETLTATDQNDIPVWQAMQDVGFEPENFRKPTMPVENMHGFLEIHIEQGRVLDEENLDLGIVTSIRAPSRHRLTVRGEYDHSGATPMRFREDALTGAATMIEQIETIATNATNDGDIVATVGDITAVNGAVNKVCGEISFPLDIRSTDPSYRSSIEAKILETCREIATNRNLAIDIEPIDKSDPVSLDPEVREQLKQSASAVGCSSRTLPSGGGHDAMNFQLEKIPTGLLFVPSIDGVSHNPDEETPTSSIAAATRTLTHTLVSVDEGGLS